MTTEFNYNQELYNEEKTEEQFKEFTKEITNAVTHDIYNIRPAPKFSLYPGSKYNPGNYSFEASKLYRALFLNAVDYVGLFKVSRPVQTDETTVESVKDVRDMFEELILVAMPPLNI